MPELPEVETICNELKKKILNKKITAVQVLRASIIKTGKFSIAQEPKLFGKLLVNQNILDIYRKAKLIVFKLKDYYLVTHLRMTGAYLANQNKQAILQKSARIVYELGDENLIYQDNRALGKIYLLQEKEFNSFFAGYGYEPLEKDFTIDNFYKVLKSKKIPIKPFLLDQKAIVGIGNIYASEMLFLSKINPEIKSNELTDSQAKLLYKYIKLVLSNAIDAQGTTFSDYRRTSGEKGNFQESLNVYNRENQMCHVCQTKIKRIVQATRSTFYCPRCQAM